MTGTQADRATLGEPDSWGARQTRELHWHDPTPTFALAATLSGLEYLTAMKDGLLPNSPIGALTGMTAVKVAPGEVEFRCVADPSFLNPIGLVHGGLVSTLLDSVLGCAVHTTLQAGDRYSSIELKVNYLRPVAPHQTLLARGWTVKTGRRIAFAEAVVVRQDDDQTVATASSSLAIDTRAS